MAGSRPCQSRPLVAGAFVLQPYYTFGIAPRCFAQKQWMDNVEKPIHVQVAVATLAVFLAIQGMRNEVSYLNEIRML
jgi:hypothetical protein